MRRADSVGRSPANHLGGGGGAWNRLGESLGFRSMQEAWTLWDVEKRLMGLAVRCWGTGR